MRTARREVSVPITVGCLLQILLEYQKHGEGVITIEDGRLVIRDAHGVISLDTKDGRWRQLTGGTPDNYETLLQEAIEEMKRP